MECNYQGGFFIESIIMTSIDHGLPQRKMRKERKHSHAEATVIEIKYMQKLYRKYKVQHFFKIEVKSKSFIIEKKKNKSQKEH